MLIAIFVLLLALGGFIGYAFTQWNIERRDYHMKLDAIIGELRRHSVFTAPHGPHGPVR